MLRHLQPLWSHTRDAAVTAYKHKTVYEIPLVFESVPKNLKVFVRDGKIVVETEPIKPSHGVAVELWKQ
jgi:pyruvate kinase